jgi:prepilin-type N-terminal cleavage/methylation domain-containing protein/prepilin-type processing-associated H-X9-DG protein
MSDAVYPYCITRASVQQDFQSGRGARFGLAGSTYGTYGTYGTHRTRRTAFTLIELLVVIAIIGILAAILFPVFTTAQQSGRRARCAQQLRQLVQANLAYADDNSGHYVPAASDISGDNLHRWHGVREDTGSPFDPARGPLWTCMGRSGGLKACPGAPNLSGTFEAGCGGFGYNQAYVGGTGYRAYAPEADEVASSSSDIAHPTRTVMFTDAAIANSKGPAEYSFAEPPYHASPDGTTYASTPSIHFRHNGLANVGWCDGHVSAPKMTFTRPPNPFYRGDNKRHSIGYFGPDDNSLFDDK